MYNYEDYSDTTSDSSSAVGNDQLDNSTITTTQHQQPIVQQLSSRNFLSQRTLVEKDEIGESNIRTPVGTKVMLSAPKRWSSISNEKKPYLKDVLMNEDSEYDLDDQYDLDDDDSVIDYKLLKFAKIEGIYNLEEYENLNVAPEVKELFDYITEFELPPLESAIDTKLYPFVPDFRPSVGDIDAFIKVVEPELKEDGLGLKVLDEPALIQSDPSVLHLQLRALGKQSSAKTAIVKKVENVGKHVKVVDKWIDDICDLHRSKPSPIVHYSKPMPDIDLLLQEWSPEVDKLMQDVQLPSPDLNCDLTTYTDIVCGMLDIPVHKSRIQSLHVLFTLYAAMKEFSGQSNDEVQEQKDFMAISNSPQILEEENETNSD